MRKVLDVIWGVWKRKYFCKGDSTQNCPTGKSPRRREPLSCPGRAAALFALLRRAGTHIDAVRWTPAQQRTAARCAASGERCGPAGGLSDVSDEGMRWEHISLVSRTRCSALRAAPQSGDPYRRCEMDPGSAAHCHSTSKTRVNALMALRCVRGTLWPRRRFIRRVSK